MKQIIKEIEELAGITVNEAFLKSGNKDIRSFRCIVIGILADHYSQTEISKEIGFGTANVFNHLKDFKNRCKTNFAFKQEYLELRNDLTINKKVK